MNNLVIEKYQQAQVRKDLPSFRPGDTIRVHVRLKEAEGDKERIQQFEGVVIKKRGTHTGASFTVRRVSFSPWETNRAAHRGLPFLHLRSFPCPNRPVSRKSRAHPLGVFCPKGGKPPTPKAVCSAHSPSMIR